MLHHVAFIIPTNKGRKVILAELGIQWKEFGLVSVHQRKSSIGFFWSQGLWSMGPHEIYIHILVHWAHGRYSSSWEASMTRKHQKVFWILRPMVTPSLMTPVMYIVRLLRILHHMETFRIGSFPSPQVVARTTTFWHLWNAKPLSCSFSAKIRWARWRNWSQNAFGICSASHSPQMMFLGFGFVAILSSNWSKIALW